MQQVLPAIYTPALITSVQKHIDNWNKKGEGVKAWAIIMKVLREHKLAEFGVQLDCEIVGVSPKNRSSMGVDAWGIWICRAISGMCASTTLLLAPSSRHLIFI